MDYLFRNTHNSSKLPYDIMRTIYEYANPIYNLKNTLLQFSLDDIMYEKMKTYILNNYESYVVLNEYGGQHIFITKENINDVKFRSLLLNGIHGYKHNFLFKRNINTICGIQDNYFKQSLIICLSDHLINDLKNVNNEKRYEIYSLKQLFKMWLKI